MSRNLRNIERLSFKLPARLQLGSHVPWEIVMPAAFFGASTMCWYDPSMAPSIVFFILGFTVLCFDSVMSYYTMPATVALSKAVTDSMSAFADDKNREQTDKLLDALADSIARALESSSLKNTVKNSIIETVSDDDLQFAAISTLQKAMQKVGDNAEFKETVFNIVKNAFVGALSDEDFVNEAMHSAVAAMVTASQDEVIRQSVVGVVTEGVSEALNDEEFIAEFRGVIKDSLSDGELYRSGAKGVFNAAFGGKKKDESERSELSSSGRKNSSKHQITSEKL